MHTFVFIGLIFFIEVIYVEANDVLGCGGFIRSDGSAVIDFSKIELELYTKQGILKDKTSCAPNNGYYFIPLYDKGEYTLQLQPPPGWSFEPTKVSLVVDGVTDVCSQGKDINFNFKGFGITGRVESFKNKVGPTGVQVQLKSDSGTRTTMTGTEGNFFFTPVIPGTYTVSISHPKWKLLSNSVLVQVAEGNTELSLNSLVVAGYDVTGYIKLESHSIDNIYLVLFQHEKNKDDVYLDGCDKTILRNVGQKQKQLCHVSLSSQGTFTFPTVSSGKYFVVPYCKERNIHFHPTAIEFEVGDTSLALSEAFEIVGFSVSGRVLSSKNGKPLKSAKVFLNENQVVNTREDGSYTFDKIKADIYKLRVHADNVEFEEHSVEINSNVLKFPDLFPTRYEVCGIILSEKSQTVSVKRAGSDDFSTAVSKPEKSGQFCIFLMPGKYNLQVSVTEGEKVQGIQFYPTSYTIEVISEPIFSLTFSQLKATIMGKVKCIREEDCLSMKIVLRAADDKEVMVDVIDNSYKFENVTPGEYRIFLISNKFCWEKDEHNIVVNSTIETAPVFVQNGYSVSFISSHYTKAKYVSMKGDVKTIDVIDGKMSFCVDKPGIYNFTLEGCHTYENNMVSFNTDSENNEVHLLALKHTITVTITAVQDFGDIFITITTADEEIETRSLTYKDGKYLITLLLAPEEVVTIIPQSDILYFKPPTAEITGVDNCKDLGIVFIAEKGKVFQGKIVPPILGVTVTIETELADTISCETNETGVYKFPPLDTSKEYKLSAKKEGYVLKGPNEQGDFIAQKLSEVIVTVVDQTDNSPLQGALLSLSGDKSYRRNLQTNEDGKITFHSLNPSEYFLRPMMKEYSFEPNSMIINVKEGIAANFTLRGKRVAYSCFGQATSLNGEPEERIIIVASGLANCSHYSEEATSEINGQFRIRGLQPYCSYNIMVKGSLDERRPIERAAPSSINVSVVTEDVHQLKFIIFKLVPHTDILVHIYSKNVDVYKTLRVKLSRESQPSGLIHTMKLDNPNYKIKKDNNAGILVHIPSVPLDDSLYSLLLEGSQNSKSKAHVQYFTANGSFKYIDMEYFTNVRVSEQNIKQTSMWTLIFTFGTLIALYNIERTSQILKSQFSKLNLSSLNFINNFRRKSAPTEYVIDKNEIDSIVQSINATKRKVKPRKT